MRHVNSGGLVESESVESTKCGVWSIENAGCGK